MGPSAASSGTVHIHEISAADSDSTLAEARALLLDYGRFVIAQPGAARFCFGSLEKEAERLPLGYREQGGGCLMALVDRTPSGFIAWRDLAPSATVIPEAWELKRLWVQPTARGLGLGRTLIHAVLDRAVATARKAVYLDTAPASMSAAHRTYLELGFVPCAPYNDNPVQGLAYLVRFL